MRARERDHLAHLVHVGVAAGAPGEMVVYPCDLPTPPTVPNMTTPGSISGFRFHADGTATLLKRTA